MKKYLKNLIKSNAERNRREPSKNDCNKSSQGGETTRPENQLGPHKLTEEQ
jgi:hypothetical protein